MLVSKNTYISRWDEVLLILIFGIWFEVGIMVYNFFSMNNWIVFMCSLFGAKCSREKNRAKKLFVLCSHVGATVQDLFADLLNVALKFSTNVLYKYIYMYLYFNTHYISHSLSLSLTLFTLHHSLTTSLLSTRIFHQELRQFFRRQ